MKNKILIIAASLIFALTICAFKLSEDSKEHETYCIVTGAKALLSNKVTITVDYGQPRKWFTDMRIKDETGKVEKFNSMVDALNYMTDDGWSFVCAYPVSMGSNLVYIYTMKKTIKEEQ